MKDIFSCWEWFSQYNEEQIKSLRALSIGKLSETKKEATKQLTENIADKEAEEDGEYILWLA